MIIILYLYFKLSGGMFIPHVTFDRARVSNDFIDFQLLLKLFYLWVRCTKILLPYMD